jgi:hypothetical protein
MEPLSINGLVMPTDFPRGLFEAVQNKLSDGNTRRNVLRNSD